LLSNRSPVGHDLSKSNRDAKRFGHEDANEIGLNGASGGRR